MREGGCPNCGNRLVTFRDETQPAGARQIHLLWLRCTKCGHVALKEWEFTEPSETVADSENGFLSSLRRRRAGG